VRDFPFWHNALKTAKTQVGLATVAADLATFQKQTGFLDEEKKLTEPQLKTLREFYTARKKALDREALPKEKPKFKK